MSEHTPGPWKIARDNYGVERIWDSELDCDIACCEGDGSIPVEIRKANTVLIAAAPELYDALKAMLADDPSFAARAKAEAAIAKAEGKATP